jgi:hypothetical protein
MRMRYLAVAAIVVAIGAPLAAQAQSRVTTGVVGGNTVVIDQDGGLAAEQRPAFREYIVEQRVPAYTVPERIVVGTVLPEVGVTFYDVPQRFGATPYRYTVVNGETVLVEPRSRRIVQVVE